MKNRILLSSIIILISMCLKVSSQPKSIIGIVTPVNEERVTLNIGRSSGIAVGSVGDVFYTITIRKNKKEINIAKIKIIKVLNNSCDAEVLEKTKSLVGQGGLRARFTASVLPKPSMENNSSPNASSAKKEQPFIIPQPSQPPEKKQLDYIPEMIYIPSGEFMIGSNNSNDNEKPVHRVKVDAFYIGRFEVTQREWITVMVNNPSSFKGNNLPVENVNWDEVQEYLQKLSKITGKRWRLPTEAEWEYACRAGSITQYCFGDNTSQLGDYAWYGDNSDNKTHPIGQKKSNVWGLYDMYGNVWEWCQDWYDEKYYSESPINNPTGPSSGSDKVIRGGGWNYNGVDYFRSAFRGNSAPITRFDVIGFRCLQEP